MSNVRLAQIFDVNSQFVPTKTSVYLKRVGSNTANYLDIDSAVSIDATNCSSISSKTNKLILDDRDTNYTDNGFMLCQNIGASIADKDFSVLNFPIKTTTPGKVWLYMRIQSLSGSFTSSILDDGITIADVNGTTDGTAWTWLATSFAIPDTETHILGIRLEEHDSSIDKIYISRSSASVSGTGPALTLAPYVTIHLQVYNIDNDFLPTTPLFVYANKSTIDEIIATDWYNFNLETLGASAISFDDSYALVMSSSGSSANNYVTWELLDNDEYQTMPSAIRYNL